MFWERWSLKLWCHNGLMLKGNRKSRCLVFDVSLHSPPVSTEDPPPASVNSSPRHTNDILGVRSPALLPHTPHISRCVSEDNTVFISVWERNRPRTEPCSFSGRIKRRRASGPGCSGESTSNDGIHHFQVNGDKCIFAPWLSDIGRYISGRPLSKYISIQGKPQLKNIQTLAIFFNCIFIHFKAWVWLCCTAGVVMVAPHILHITSPTVCRFIGCQYFGLFTSCISSQSWVPHLNGILRERRWFLHH